MKLSSKLTSKIRQPNDCWLWVGATNAQGYGYIIHSGEIIPAHRAVYEELRGPIPKGKVLDHLCRIRCCVNPSHLEPVDLVQNIMRGEGACAQNARKTHCPKGHELVVVYGKKCRRRCIECHKASSSKSQKKRLAEKRAAREAEFNRLLETVTQIGKDSSSSLRRGR